MSYEDNPRSIKYHVKQFLLRRADDFRGRTIVDLPAGNGITSKILHDVGARVLSFDLFPDQFKAEGLKCQKLDIRSGIPLPDESVDGIICQEGIEHFQDQLAVLREFGRVIKAGGVLLITTPNYSNLRSKLSYLLSESERFGSHMPPNELDDLWRRSGDGNEAAYFGHIFLTGIQKLRTLARLADFRIKEVHFTRARPTSIMLFPFLYPFIFLFNWMTYRKRLKKAAHPEAIKKEVYQEQFKLAVSPQILISGHLMVEFVRKPLP